MSRVLKNYSDRVTQGYHSGHGGVDVIGNIFGADFITAHSAGTVTAAVSGYGNNPGSSGMASYGNYVDVTHANGSKTRYAHLQYVSVSKGKRVERGTTLGYMGNSGNSYGTHLHFEYYTPAGVRSNPLPYLTANLPGLSTSSTGNSGSGSSSGNSNTGSATSGGNSAGATSEAKAETKDITKVVVKSTEGSTASHSQGSLSGTKMLGQGVEILIQNGSKIMLPCVEGTVTLESKRKGSPAVLKFSCVKDSVINFQEGNPVTLRVNGANIFFGYVFDKSRISDMPTIQVTCYDQLRYFKNKDTYIYAKRKYSDLVRMLAADFGLSLGTIEDTGYVIPARAEEATLFDICGNASDETVLNTGKLFVLYDDFGKICLKSIESMKVPLLIDEDTAQSFSYSSSIDKDVYTKIKLAQDNDETGEREIYEINNAALQKQWGVLQYYENADSEGTVLKEKAKLLADYYGKKNRSLKVNGCLGDVRIRGGCSLVVKLGLGDINVQNWMVVESVKHSFSNGLHLMDLELSGIKGEFN